MIKANNAIRTARTLLGTPYSEMDCIRLIVMVIRRTAGGDANYRCEGTNWLWNSIDNSAKYRHLTWRQESTAGAAAGMLAFKRDGENVHHVGLVTGEGTVIHSSSVYGMVVETILDGSWHLLGKHKWIEAEVPAEEPGTPAGGTSSVSGEAGATFPKGEGETCESAFTSLIRDDGTSIMLAGRWRVAQD